VVLTEFDNISNVTRAPIVEAFPSIGLVSVMTGKQLIKALKLPIVGVIQSDHFQVSCVVSHEQPSFPARVYGNEHLVVFLCEMAFKVPPETIQSLVQCVYDFAHRHRSPMIYTIEGMPRPPTIELPSGESVRIRLANAPSGGGETGEDEENEDEAGGDEGGLEELMLIDDAVLTKLTMREKEKEPEGDGNKKENVKDEKKLHPELEKRKARQNEKMKTRRKKKNRMSTT